MDTFNLNSELYNDEEIETLFNLKKPYTQSEILKAKDVLLTQLISNKSLGSEKQREISFFIDTISTRITNKINNNSTNNNSTNNNSTNNNNNNNIIQLGSNFLIENVNTIAGKNTQLLDGRLAGQGNVPPGFLNPINVRTITQTINIDSRFRPNYYGSSATNFSVSLPSTQKNVVKMRIASIEVPLSYHAISKFSGNSTCLIIDANNTTNCWLVILPDGNYEQSWAGESNAAHIETAMNNAIATATPGILNLNTGSVTLTGAQAKIRPLIDLCFTVDRVSGRSVFAVPQAGSSTSIFTSKGFTVRFNIDGDGTLNLETNIQMRLGWQLGFRSAQYICGGGANGAGACLSEGICLICGPRYGFISIEDYQKNTSPSYIVAYANSILQNNVITRVNLSSVLGDVGVYQVSNDLGLDSQTGRSREYFGAVDIQKLHISMYDEYGRFINLNNMDWSFTLEFDKLYD
jgi:hypothetical protein